MNGLQHSQPCSLASQAAVHIKTADPMKLSCTLWIISNVCICESKRQILFFANKIMHKFKMRYNFVEQILNRTYISSSFHTTKVIKKKKNFVFTKLNKQRFDHEINYNYITWFKFWLSLLPLLILNRTPFNWHCESADPCWSKLFRP